MRDGDVARRSWRWALPALVAPLIVAAALLVSRDGPPPGDMGTRSGRTVLTYTGGERLVELGRRGPYPAPHFVEAVRALLLDDPAIRGALAKAGVRGTREERSVCLTKVAVEVRTTLDRRLQQEAEAAVEEVLGGDPETTPAAAVVLAEPATGRLRALVSSRDFFSHPSGQIDLATRQRRSVGAAFFPVAMAAALESGLDPGATYPDLPTIQIPVEDSPGKPFVVSNHSGGSSKPITLAEAMRVSSNTVFAGLSQKLRPEKVTTTAAALGIRSPVSGFPSTLLGVDPLTTLDLATAYATLANEGIIRSPVLVSKITAADRTILYRSQEKPRPAVRAETARAVTEALVRVVCCGTAAETAPLPGERPAAGKTGTSQEFRDAWFVGYTPQLVSAVWVGFPETPRPMVPPATPIRVTGGTYPARIWNLLMARAHEGLPIQQFP